MKLNMTPGRGLISVLVILAACMVAAAAWLWRQEALPVGEEAYRPELTVERAVFADQLLWMRTRVGSLIALGAEDQAPERVPTEAPVEEICRFRGRLLALSHDERRRLWTLRSRSASGWSPPRRIPTEGDAFVALACEGGAVALVTSRRLIELGGGAARVTRLSEEVRPPLAGAAALATPSAVWVGFNNGEWGGGLARIDRATGRYTTVASNRTGQLCGGPLNSDCDAVNGIIVSPRDASCVVAAVGVVHMSSRGRLVEVCGTRVRRLYFRGLDPQPPNNILDEGEPSSTVAFFGLARTADAVWAIGLDGLYRFGDGRVSFVPLPEFTDRSGYWVSFDVPGVVLVATDYNQRASMSGSVPIMALR